jgi:hypothetical protein
MVDDGTGVEDTGRADEDDGLGAGGEEDGYDHS